MRFSIPFFAAAITLVFAGCGTGKPEIVKVNPAYGKYVSAYTSGMVTRQSSVRIELKSIDSSLIPDDGDITSNTEILGDIFEFEPAIEGKAVWADDHTIEFVPAEKLPENQFYDVHFDLDKIAKVKSGFEDFHFQFSTYQQNIFVEVDGLYDYEDYSFSLKQARGSLETSDVVEEEELQKVFSAELDGKKMPLHFEKGYEDNRYYFFVDSITRKDDEGKLIIRWDGAAINAFQEGKEELTVPALGDFFVENVRVIDREDQTIEIMFSEPLAQQDLNGLITLQGAEKLTYAINYNTVTVYLPNRIVGDRQLNISSGIRNQKGYAMKNGSEEFLTLTEPKPLVRLRGDGCILPSTNGLIFPFEAISLKSVEVRVVKIYETNVHSFLQVNNMDGDDGLTRFGKVVARKKIRLDYDKSMDLKTWNNHVIDLDKLIKADPGAIYRVSIKFGKEDAICDCPADEEGAVQASRSSEEDSHWNENYWYGFDDGFDTWYYYEDDYSACDEAYYNGKAVSRNILASDLGMICKIDQSKVSHAFVNDMLTTAPAASVQVEYYDFAKQLIAEGRTDAQGMLDVALNRKPFLMIAKRGSQRGYLKLADGNSNSMSQFDIEGEDIQDGVKGFFYAERGVWRPGDSIYLNLILQDPDKKLPEGHPVKFQLRDPNGQVVSEFTRTKNVNGTYDFRTATVSGSPTGSYIASATVGNRTFSKSLLVETIKPNRLKIYLDVSEKSARDSLAKLEVKWLHGANAGALKTDINVTVRSAATQFAGYKDYVFDSPVRSVNSEKQLIFEGYLNANGETQVPTRIPVGTNAPGKLRASYLTKVFEKGGDFSIDRKDVIYSPFERYVGVRVPDADNPDNSLETGKPHKIDIAVVDENGKPSNADRLQVKIYKLEWRFWYERGNENLGEYIARSGAMVYNDTVISAKNGKASYNLKVNYPEYGRYLVTVTDLDGKHQTGATLMIDWPYWSRGNRKENTNATMLNFSCDKERYVKGEEVKITFPSSAGGRALISVETSRKVLNKFWVTTAAGETKCSFLTTAEMTPNAYVHVTMVQPHATTKNDLPIRMYGVVPIVVDDPSTHLHPLIAMADEIRPESTTNINVREADGKRMTYTLAVVDEGLLNLTSFRTPDPHSSFYAREALKVRTWDMYDYVIGAYAGKLDKLLSIGGDGGLKEGEGAKANRFKPVVTHLGPFVLEPGQSANHKVTLPNYMGAVRVMVVAQQDKAYGSAEKSVYVKSPLMVLATLPRVLGPGEEVQLPVNVFATEKNIKDVKVTIECNDLLSVNGPATKSLTFAEPTDEVVNFRLNVAKRLGIAKVKVTAVCGGERSVQEIELDVRTPNPLVTSGQDVVIQPGKTWTGSVQFSGISGTNKATVEMSAIPPIGLERRLAYLIQYPHGCIEQTTSAAFPQLLVSNLTNLKPSEAAEISVNVKAALGRLGRFQTASGGFGYWPGEGNANEWGTSYAGHFMLEAETRGYNVSPSLKNRWLAYQQREAKNWSPNSNRYVHSHAHETHELEQAYRLYTLALAKKPELGAMNRLREQTTLSETAKWRLAAAYQLSGQPDIAKKLVANLGTSVPKYRELSYSFGSKTRDEAMILEALSLMNNFSRAASVATEVARKLNSEEWMSTQETAYSLLAISEYASAKGSSGVQYSWSLNDQSARPSKSGKAMDQLIFSEKDISGKGKVTIKNTGGAPIYVKLMVEGRPLVGDKSSASNQLEMRVEFTDMNGNDIQPEKITQGSDFVAVVTLINPTKNSVYKEMALTQIFPSGWEIHNARMSGEGQSSSARYQDIRDDRVYTYYDLGPLASKTFRIHLNATYMGKFYLPSFYSEAMYDRLINAKSGGRWVEVIPQGSGA
jgi:alpha-2-macroglobulin